MNEGALMDGELRGFSWGLGRLRFTKVISGRSARIPRRHSNSRSMPEVLEGTLCSGATSGAGESRGRLGRGVRPAEARMSRDSWRNPSSTSGVGSVRTTIIRGFDLRQARRDDCASEEQLD